MKTCFTMTNIKYKLSNRDGYPSRAGRCNVVITNILKIVFRKPYNHIIILQGSRDYKEALSSDLSYTYRGCTGASQQCSQNLNQWLGYVFPEETDILCQGHFPPFKAKHLPILLCIFHDYKNLTWTNPIFSHCNYFFADFYDYFQFI